jgi:uncharacterized membrane protein
MTDVTAQDLHARALVLEWTDRGAIPQERLGDALAIAGVRPDREAWRMFLDRLLLWCGTLFLGAGAIFLIAANWGRLGAFAQFAAVETAVLGAAIAACVLGVDRTAGKALLLLATLLLGGLLALVGQTYQTGADSWQLFAAWAALALPWAIVARFPAFWVLWILLLNLGVGLYVYELPVRGSIVLTTEQQVWTLFGVNTLAWLVWELLVHTRGWRDERWAVRVLAVASGGLITGLAVVAVFSDESVLPFVVYGAWLAALYFVYRRRLFDLFMVAGACLSVIVFAATALGALLLDSLEGIGFLLIAAAVIGLSAGAARWIRHMAAEHAHE